MPDAAIQMENLGKRYTIAHRRDAGYGTLRDALAGAFRPTRPAAGDAPPRREEFWALRELDHAVTPGEVLAVIGRNGAGKSTLLKLLSRITAPTTGRIRYRGRVASLLEVGTGFHPELSGRENIFLNGAILGMTRPEIRRKFDAIVAFAEIEKFLDTPVKRYSSGMYVRLAFAVAANLEPDILLVDEVLAVGDAAFQKKCLGRMQEVTGQEGRTVLFVSHNMQAVQSLCRSALYLQGGRKVAAGEVRAVVGRYLSDLASTGAAKSWAEDEAPGNHEIRLLGVRARGGGEQQSVFPTARPVEVEMTFRADAIPQALTLGFDLMNAEGLTVLRSYQSDQDPRDWPTAAPGLNTWRCTIPAGLLNAGIYYISPRISVHNVYWIAQVDGAVQFEMVLDHGVSPYWNSLDATSRPGLVSPILRWETVT